MDNKQKYQKYKTKYLYLKNQVGGYTMSSGAIPTDRTGLYLTIPFDAKLKDTLIDKVLIECNIPYLSENHSAEGGFELPLTQEWKSANLRNKDLLNYHDARQLRFVEGDGVIATLRFKDNINYWSDEELDKLNNCITSAVKSLQLNNKEINKEDSRAIPSNREYLYLTIPFEAKYKEAVIDKVLIDCNIPNLSKHYSSERGFELPLTSAWMSANLKNKNLLHYHNSRQLRFDEENGIVTSLRFNDGINYWSDEELDKLNNCITNAIMSLKINKEEIINEKINKKKINKEDKSTDTYSDTNSGMFSSVNSPFGPPTNPFVPQQAPIIVGQIYYFQRGVPVENSVEFVVRVINMAQASLLLKGLDQEYSQGGFQLPHNDFSKKMLNLNPFAQHIIARQLVFVINNNVIIGLRHKDNIVNWQSNEITELLNICNTEISRMYIPIIPVVPLANSAFVPSSYINSLNSASVEEFDDVNFTRFKQYKIKFNKPIDIKLKDKLIKKVVSKAEDKKLLKYIKKSDSPNGGFYLPITRSWFKFSKNLKIRELIFMIKDDKITGLRFADDITLWTNNEVNKLLDIIYSVNRKLSKK